MECMMYIDIVLYTNHRSSLRNLFSFTTLHPPEILRVTTCHAEWLCTRLSYYYYSFLHSR